MPMPPDVERYLRSLAHRFNEPDLREAAKDVERLRAELDEATRRIAELDHAYQVIHRHGTGSYDFSLLRIRAQEWVEKSEEVRHV